MADDKVTSKVNPEKSAPSEQNTNSNDDAAQAIKDQARDIERGYEAARRELDQALERLRMEMQRLRLQESGAKARAWIEDNPALALVGALGGGVVIGRLLRKAVTPAPPPPMPVRARMKANKLATRAGGYAHELGDLISEQANV